MRALSLDERARARLTLSEWLTARRALRLIIHTYWSWRGQGYAQQEIKTAIRAMRKLDWSAQP